MNFSLPGMKMHHSKKRTQPPPTNRIDSSPCPLLARGGEGFASPPFGGSMRNGSRWAILSPFRGRGMRFGAFSHEKQS
jgi:hypothetical protein